MDWLRTFWLVVALLFVFVGIPFWYQRARRHTRSKVGLAFDFFCMCATVTCVVMLVMLVTNVFRSGWQWLDLDFLTRFPSRHAEIAGIRVALLGSIWLTALTAVFALPTGVGAAVYLEEYAAASRWKRFVQTNIANLAGVPSIVYGILGLSLFVQFMNFGPSLIAGALTLSLVVLPIIILATQEALRGVPDSVRHGSYALGATKWQTVRCQVLPAAIPGIMTGIIIAFSRAIGEAAPLVAVGAVASTTFVPTGPTDEFSALPLRIYYWAGQPEAEFHGTAAAAIIVLLVVLICMNALAVFIRQRYAKRIRW